MRKFLIPLAVVAVSVLGALTLLATSPKLEPTVPEAVPTTVRTLLVTPVPVRLTVHSQGSVAPSTESDLVPEVSGRVIRAADALVPGGSFRVGDVLLELDRNDYEATVARAQASLTRADAEYEHSKFEYLRLESLQARELISRSQLENAQRAYRIAEATQQDARVALEQAERDLSRTRMTAPFTGLVRTRQVDVGQFVSRGSPVATIYATDYVEVRLPLADQQLAYLDIPLGQLGQIPATRAPKVTLTTEYAGQSLTWHGIIVRTEAEIDMKSRMVNVVALVRNAEQTSPLSVGMFVDAEIEGRLAPNVVVLPRTALRDGDQVLLVDTDDRLHYRTVDTLRLYRDEVLIEGGLNAGERVCISPLQTVIEGMLVNPVEGG